jgi:stress response protein YsnF
MITREQIPQVVGQPVHDAEGKKIGDAKHIYLDDATGAPEWVTVGTGLLGGNETFVPTRSAQLVEDHLEVPYAKDKIKGAPNVDVDAGGHLSAAEERHLYDYYGITRGGGAEGGRAGTGGDAGTRGTGGEAGMAAAGAGGMAGGAAGARGRSGPGAGTDAADPSAARFAAGRTGPAERTGGFAERGAAGQESDEAMTRSEEELHVSVERREAGRARLHKYVEVEEAQETVPLRHEEVRLEREPITESNRGAALSGPEISEADHYVTLHEDRPVVETEVVPKERVRMRVEEHTEQRTVRGRVRKERIEAEVPDADTGTQPGTQGGGRSGPRR